MATDSLKEFRHVHAPYNWRKGVSKEIQDIDDTKYDYWPTFAENVDEVKCWNEPGDYWAGELYDNQ